MKLRSSIFPALAWLAIIWLMSSLPSKELPSIRIIGFDKLAHISVYAILGFLCNSWMKSRKLSRVEYILVYALLLLSAAADEYHQNFIPGRSVTVYDLMANTIGLLIPLSIGLLTHDKRK